MKTSSGYKDIGVLVDTSSDWGRRMVEGIISHSMDVGSWNIWIEPHGQEENLRLPKDWNGAGIIARVSSLEMAEHLLAYQVPIVNVSRIGLGGNMKFPRVTVDPRSSAKLAFEHFRERGFRNFAYVEPSELPFVQEHYLAFAQIVEAHGMECSLYSTANAEGQSMGWTEKCGSMRDWLRALEKPVAVFTWGSDIGRLVISSCNRAGIPVPHQVAVLGGDDDKLLSQASLPALSGIVVPARSIGRRAAEILEELMSGKGISNKFITIESSRINARASSDTYALSDCATLQALHYLRENFMRPISINDLLEAVPMARRTLEIKFNRYLGRSPADELRALRIAHAQKLLVETELSLQEVAEKCGLSSYNYLSHFFKKSTGETPAHYRKMARLSR